MSKIFIDPSKTIRDWRDYWEAVCQRNPVFEKYPDKTVAINVAQLKKLMAEAFLAGQKCQAHKETIVTPDNIEGPEV